MLRKGAFQIYDIDEVVYTLGVPAAESYQLKTVLVDSIDRGDGTFSYVQHRYRRSTPADAWTYQETWSIQADARELVVNEGNTAFVKYRFPMDAGYAWNGNNYNSMGDDTYTYEAVKVTQEAGGTSYNDCLVINQENNDDFVVFLDSRSEVYARNVGLISRNILQLHYCTATASGCLGQQIIEEGVDYTQTLVAYGLE